MSAQNQKLLAIARAMSRLPYAERIMVFGSMAEGSETPGDIDVFVDLSETPYTDSLQCREFFDLIRLANKHYGYVDPFIRFADDLVVRNDAATGWVTAKNKRGITKNMLAQAKPLKDVIRHYAKALETDESPAL
jgi:predicted nucleotidyltransferase